MRKSLLSMMIFSLVATACSSTTGEEQAQQKTTVPKVEQEQKPQEESKPVAKESRPTAQPIPTPEKPQKIEEKKNLEDKEPEKPAPSKEVEKETKPTPSKVVKSEQNKTTQTKESQQSTLGDFEQQVVELVNQERQKAGLSPLKISSKVAELAEEKSADMKNHNYFAHDSPNLGSAFDQLQANQVSYSAAGENIAAGQRSPSSVMKSWMNSPGHRANILNQEFTHIGVGYVKGGSYGTYWTQIFIKK